MRCLAGSDPANLETRVAFIEKTPRVRIAPFTQKDTDFKAWKQGPKGCGGDDPERNGYYGFYQPSREWCDTELLALGYALG